MSVRANVDRSSLNERIEFQRKAAGQDADGFPTGGWSSLGTVWCSMDATKANERFVADGTRSVGAMTCWIRSDVFVRLKLTAGDRAIWKGKTYDIQDVPDQQLRARLIAVFLETGLNLG